MTDLGDHPSNEGGVPSAEALVEDALEQYARTRKSWVESEVRRAPAVQAILTAPDELRRDCLLWLVSYVSSEEHDRKFGSRVVFNIAARRRLPLTVDDVAFLLGWAQSIAAEPREVYDSLSAFQVVKVLTKQIETMAPSWSESERAEIAPLILAAARVKDYPTSRRLSELIVAPEGLPLSLIAPGDDASERMRAVFESSGERQEALAQTLEALGGYPEKGKPSATWTSSLDAVCAALAEPAALVAELLDALLESPDTEGSYTYYGRTYPTIRFLGASNDRFACAVAAIAGTLSDASLLPRLRRLAIKSVVFIGVPYGKPRSLRLANACAQAIGRIGAPASVTELLTLERSVRHGGLLKEVRKSIGALAKAHGMTREELLERSVEDHGLDRDGRYVLSLTSGSASLEVDASGVTLAYTDEHGARKKSFPARVRRFDAELLATMRDKRKAIGKTLAGQRGRLEGMMRQERRWRLSDWLELYLNHPITGRLTRTLIWDFQGADGRRVTGIPVDAETALTDAGEPVRIPSDAATRLWHPIRSTPEAVRAWRLYLLGASVRQPFKQAFREVYLLTPAEAETKLYSNRFAGHIVGQAQARAVLKRRRWTASLVHACDEDLNPGVAHHDFEPFSISAEFTYSPVGAFGAETDHYTYCTSDQVRFHDIRDDSLMPLADVPPLVFTEAMRDVDLLVGVTSIGTDPEWLDRGENRQFESYWQDFNFGELTAAAAIRRQVLEQLLPRLAIADRCELQDRYLLVRNDARSYRIHFGSGNVLMSSNDQYLCIVAARDRRASKLFLPFDDDPVLSLILSKAFMLAEDSQVGEPTIVAQIDGPQNAA